MKRGLTMSWILLNILISGCSTSRIEGKWQYNGGIYNDKPQAASSDFKMQRIYNDNNYEAYLLEANMEPRKYAAGTYQIKKDSLFLTGTFSSQPSQLVGHTQLFLYAIKDSVLTIKGTLPNGMEVEEYWKKID